MTTQALSPTSASLSLADTGLLLVRVATGAAILHAGLVKAFDFTTATAHMEADWRLPTLAAFMLTAAEVLGGAGVLLGAFTPFAACMVIAVMVDAWAVKVSTDTIWTDPFNLPFVLALGAAALMFAGAGSLSVDARLLGRTRWSPRLAAGLLVVAIVAAVVTWVALNGSNPVHVTAVEG